MTLNTKKSIFPELFTAEEVAKILRTTPQNVRKMLRLGIIPSLKVGREYRVPEHVLITLLHSLLLPIKDMNG